MMARKAQKKTLQQASGLTEAVPPDANHTDKLKVLISEIDKNLQ